MNQTTTYTIRSLADLTGRTEDDGKALPDALIKAITAICPEAAVETGVQAPPPGMMGRLIPRTNIVVKAPQLTLAFVRALGNAWVSALLFSVGENVGGFLAGADGLDRLREMRAAFDRLAVDRGERCTFVAVVKCGDKALLPHGIYPSVAQVLRAHGAIRQTCTETGCDFHRGNCQVSDNDIGSVIEELVARAVLDKHPGETLWPAR